MSMINYASREINCKIVYYGPGLSGKTTNLKQIYEQVPAESKGEMVSLATEDERTLFFDFLPLDLGTVQGFKTLEKRTGTLLHDLAAEHEGTIITFPDIVAKPTPVFTKLDPSVVDAELARLAPPPVVGS